MNRFLFILFFLINMLAFGQQAQTFSVEIEEDTIPGMQGLQSFVVGQAQGKWLFIGGRKDGLHQRQPFSSFLASGNNTNIYVIDPVSKQFWLASLNTLPQGIQEQLQSTNINFKQVNDLLYIIGGYGYSTTAADHITYPNITIVNVSSTINAIIASSSITSFFRQITDQRMAITGGQLENIDSVFYLVGGHRFDGRYNPNNNPTFTQTYSDEIRKFKISDNGTTFSIYDYIAINDPANLHRRDYNLVPQIFPTGDFGFTAFTGVFQPVQDLPWLNTVDIKSNAYAVNNTFSQYLSQYHSAKMPLWDSTNNEMHSIFFGGMSRYTLDTSTNTLIDDVNVPFVKTISRVTRESNGNMMEYKLPIEMPALLGSGAEFINISSDAYLKEGIISLNRLPMARTLVGYIYGGIESTLPNIFFINNGTQSVASSRLFKVYINKSPLTSTAKPQKLDNDMFSVFTYPNPADHVITINVKSQITGDLKIILQNEKGEMVSTIVETKIKHGNHEYIWNRTREKSGVYFVVSQIGNVIKTSKVILK
ncbi:MAG: T9SS type A sorting domain-containing protein [Bacteroidia bacterium]|nr:T9SS type A sorting domain-containing protein [Bacteroidia bacterium]